VVDRIKEEVTGIKLEDAEVVVSGGRGMGNGKDFGTLRELADVLVAPSVLPGLPVTRFWAPPRSRWARAERWSAPNCT